MAEENIKFVKRIRNALARFISGTEGGATKLTTMLRPDQQGGYAQMVSRMYYDLLLKSSSRLDKYERYTYLDDNLAEASSALNLYADNIVSGSVGGEENYSVVIDENAPQKDKVEEIVKLNEYQSGIKDIIWDIAREMTCYGDLFEELVIDEDKAKCISYISKVKELPRKQIYADVDDRGVFINPLFPYIQKKHISDKEKTVFDWWRIIHFKIGQGVYGVDNSLFANASQRIGRQLLWIDESLVIARMSRAWQRFAWMIDTTGMSPDEKFEYIDKFMDRLKRTTTVDEETGQLHPSRRPLMPDEDVAVPVEKDSKQDVKVLSGDMNISQIEDVRYLQTKFLMAVSTPKAYMSIEEGTRAKATLQQIDVQFARQTRRRQQALQPGLKKFYQLAFILGGIDHTQFKWDIVFPELNTVDEMVKWEMMKLKVEVAKILAVDIGAVNNKYIYYEVLGLTDEQVEMYAFLPPGEETLEYEQLPPETASLVKQDPQVRQILNDFKDIVSWKLAHREKMIGMVKVG